MRFAILGIKKFFSFGDGVDGFWEIHKKVDWLAGVIVWIERCNLFPDEKPFPHSFVGASVSLVALVTFVPGGRAAHGVAFFPTSVSSPVGLLPLLFRGCLLTKFLQDPHKTK